MIKEEPTYLYDSDSCELEKSEAAIVFDLMKILSFYKMFM